MENALQTEYIRKMKREAKKCLSIHIFFQLISSPAPAASHVVERNIVSFLDQIVGFRLDARNGFRLMRCEAAAARPLRIGWMGCE